jgi:hypothetical protein
VGHISNSWSSSTSPAPGIIPSPTNSTPGAAPTNDIIHSSNAKKSTGAIVGGVLGAFVVLVVAIGAIFYTRRRRYHAAGTSQEEIFPFTAPRVNRDFTSDIKGQSAAGRRVTTITSTTLQSWPPGDRHMRLESPQHSSDTNTYQFRSTLSSPVLAQLGEELFSLRTEVRQLQEVQQGLTSTNGGNNEEPPPEYFPERDRGRAERLARG